MFNLKSPPVPVEFTFYQDFQIADRFGEKGIRETYKNVKEYWLDDPAAWGEVVCALNWRLWDLYKDNEKLARIYQDLWQEAQDTGWKQFENDKEKADIYFRKID